MQLMPLTPRQGQSRLGIGFEATTVRYQDSDRTVTVTCTRCGLWGIGKVFRINGAFGPFARVIVSWIKKIFVPF
jgi:hypothetical protein